jgi:hypothetical protein
MNRLKTTDVQDVTRQSAATRDAKAAPAVTVSGEALGTSPLQRAQQEHIAQLRSGPSTGDGGLPDSLMSGIETLSGEDMSGVRVHRNSAKPATLGAQAYAQGTDIHLGPGQEKHLPHEAWHVVQQRQGRVAPTHQVGGVDVNGDTGLEREADAMGSRAMSVNQSPRQLAQRRAGQSLVGAPVQRVVGPRPELPFRSNLEWARWFAAMTPTELDEQLGSLVMTRDLPAVARMNEILIRNGEDPLTDALPPSSQEGDGLVIGGKGNSQAEGDEKEKETASTTPTPKQEVESPDERYQKRIAAVRLNIRTGEKSKQLALELINAYGEIIGSTSGNEGTIKTITKKVLGQATVAKGSHVVPTGGFHPAFKSTHDAFVVTTESDKHLEMLKLAGSLDAGLPTQPDFFEKLGKGMSHATGKGHASVKMAKIPLIKSVEYSVYGKTHAVTHLYIQTGNETEIRCYLGTEVGPFQRIHTSLTVQKDETPTAHTMVQVSKTLGIPPFAGTGVRVGFDSTETEAGMGFGARLLTGRSKAQCTVTGYIDGMTLLEVGTATAGQAEAMAKSFNRTLDAISKDICSGEIGKRSITWLSEFTPIDERK